MINEADSGLKNHSKELDSVHTFSTVKRLRETVLATVRMMK